MSLKQLLKLAAEFEEKLPQTQRTPVWDLPYSDPGARSGLRSLVNPEPISGVQVIDTKKNGPDQYGMDPEDYTNVDMPRMELIEVVKKIVDNAAGAIRVIAKGGGKKDVDRAMVGIRKILMQAEGLVATNLHNYNPYANR